MAASQKSSSPVVLGALGEQLGFHLAQASVITTSAYNACVGEPLQLRKVEYSMLMLLRANAALSPKQLAKALALTAPNLTLLLDRLQERDLLVRERNPNDGRSQHVRLSASGLKLIAKADKAAVDMKKHWQSKLSAAESAMLIELLTKVYQD
jgi:DNA-binding MarR family transcriptional regulator